MSECTVPLTLDAQPVTSAEYQTRACCLLALGYLFIYFLGNLKNVLDKIYFSVVNKLGISYCLTE